MTNKALRLDPALTLAFALHHTRGAYALLLGSGVSTAAGIPTGWEITQALAQRVALLSKAETENPLAWYSETFNEEPSYSRLLEAVAKTPAERRNLLREFIEPSEEDRSEGRKVPTAAHRAIAQLVQGGYVRVVLTTNFDQLLETALRDIGISPAVVASADGIAGMMPLHTAPVTIIKLHGDYLDTRIKNTPDELAKYDGLSTALLDRVLDEYGLIICGWSGVWDEALRDAITRCSTRRFATYWAAKGAIAPEAMALVDTRRADVVPVDSANAFLSGVVEHVQSLEDLARPHPLSTPLAVAALKRYVPVAEHRVRLHDLVIDAADSAQRLALSPEPPEARLIAIMRARMDALSAATERLMALLAMGAYHGGATHRPLWVRVIERLGTLPPHSEGISYDIYSSMRYYPAQLAFYAAGLGAAAAGDDDGLADLLLLPMCTRRTRGRAPAALTVNNSALLDRDAARSIFTPKRERAYFPMSDELRDVLRPALREVLPDDERYDQVFDRFEYLVALASLAVQVNEAGVGADVSTMWPPIGGFGWRRGHPGETASEALRAEIALNGDGWFLCNRTPFREQVVAHGLAVISSWLAHIDRCASRACAY